MKTQYVVLAALMVVLSVALVQTGQAVNARQQDGSTAGAQMARADFRNDDTQPHAGCEEHGVDVTQYPGWCLGFKASYLIQWAILKAGQ